MCRSSNYDGEDGTPEVQVVYMALRSDGEYGPNSIWTRSVGDFTGQVVVDGAMVPRFELVEELE